MWMFLLSPEDERFLKRSQSFVRYGFAALMDRFGLDPARIAPLTDRQILQFYFHPRDKDGSLKVDAVEALEDTKPETFDEAVDEAIESFKRTAAIKEALNEFKESLKTPIDRLHDFGTEVAEAIKGMTVSVLSFSAAVGAFSPATLEYFLY